MRVALGTIEVDDETRKKIRKLNDGKGEATRQEVKDFLLKAIENDVIPNIGVESEEPPAPPVSVDGSDRQHAMAAATSDEELPEPPTRDFP